MSILFDKKRIECEQVLEFITELYDEFYITEEVVETTELIHRDNEFEILIESEHNTVLLLSAFKEMIIKHFGITQEELCKLNK